MLVHICILASRHLYVVFVVGKFPISKFSLYTSYFYEFLAEAYSECNQILPVLFGMNSIFLK